MGNSATTRRKVRGEGDARACLDEVKRSGGKLRDWARSNGVDGRSLNMWRVVLSRRVNAPSVRLIELSLPLVPPDVAAARYVVRCGELAVEVDDRFDDATLRRLLSVVTSC